MNVQMSQKKKIIAVVSAVVALAVAVAAFYWVSAGFVKREIIYVGIFPSMGRWCDRQQYTVDYKPVTFPEVACVDDSSAKKVLALSGADQTVSGSTALPVYKVDADYHYVWKSESANSTAEGSQRKVTKKYLVIDKIYSASYAYSCGWGECR